MNSSKEMIALKDLRADLIAVMDKMVENPYAECYELRAEMRAITAKLELYIS